MGLFPEIASQPNPSFVSTWSPECEGYNVVIAGNAASGNAVIQNMLYLSPVRIETPRIFVAMGWHNGVTSHGNCAAGIYTLAGARLDYTAHTAQGNVSEAQAAALTNANVLLQPGVYYWVFGSNSATGTFFRGSANLNLQRTWGFSQIASGYANPLPATITPAWPLTVNQTAYVWATKVAVQ